MSGGRVARLFRSAISGTFFVLYGIFALPFAAVLPLPLVSPRLGRAVVRLFYRIFVFTARVVRLYTVEVSDADRRRLAGLRGCVVAMNHISLIDICVILAHLPDSVCIAKASAKRNPFLSAVVSKLFISNDVGGEAAVAEAVAFLEKGVNVVVFPQGTRGGTTLHRGAARISLASRAHVVVVHADYDPVVLAKGQPWYDVGDRVIRIRLSVRDEIVPEGRDCRREAVAMTARIAASMEIATPRD